MKGKRSAFIVNLLLGAALVLAAVSPCARAEPSATSSVVFDGTLGSSAGGLEAVGNEFTIASDRGELAEGGRNLFHSFSDFSILNGDIAVFQGPESVENVLARVTGENITKIEGTLRTRIKNRDGANLFLMNPNGIMIGPGAVLDLGGDFNVTSADWILFRDADGNEQGRFWANGSGDVSVLSAPPSAFGFDAVPELAGEVKVSDGTVLGEFVVDGPDLGGENVRLVGRAVVVEETYLQSPGAEIALVAVGQGADTVGIDADSGRVAEGRHAGAVRVEDAAIVVAGADGGRILISGGDVDLVSTKRIGEGAGAAFCGINASARGESSGGEIVVSGSTINVVEGAELFASEGGIRIEGGTMRIDGANNDGCIHPVQLMDGTTEIRRFTRIALETSSGAAAAEDGVVAGGQVRIDLGGDLWVVNDGAILSSTSNAGVGGPIMIDIDGKLQISGDSEVTSLTTGEGRGGAISVRADSLRIDSGRTENFTGILSLALGAKAGVADDENRDGDGGSIDIWIREGANISDVGQIASSTSGGGDGGSVIFHAGSLEIVGANIVPMEDTSDFPPNWFLTGISTKASLTSSGSTGNITVTVDGEIRLRDGGLINAADFSDDIESGAGDVTVTAGSIFADREDSYYFTGIGAGSAIELDGGTEEIGGNGGELVVTARTIELHDGGQIGAATRSAGDAGNITVYANRIVADGLGIDPGEFDQFTYSRAAGILAEALEGATGSGGSVTIRPHPDGLGSGSDGLSMALTGGAEIAARSEAAARFEDGKLADGSGAFGGSVDIFWPDGEIMVGEGSTITALSGPLAAGAGSVVVSTGQLTLRGGSLSVESQRLEKAGVSETGADAGNLTLNSVGRILLEQGTFTASAGENGGGIVIVGGDLIDVRRSTIEAEAENDGGELTITEAPYLLLDESTVTANAVNGTGGSIDITTGVFLTNLSSVTASSQFGADGVVRIDPQVVLSGNEGEAEAAPLDATDALQPECTQRIPTKAGSLIKAGRGGTARVPGGYLPSLRLLN